MTNNITSRLKITIAVDLCLTLSLLVTTPSLATQAGESSLCQQHKHSLWKIKQQGEKAIILSLTERDDMITPEIDRSYGSSVVNLNNDDIKDLHLHLEMCGSGGCVDTWVIGCGNNLYYPVIAPEYNENLTIDENHSVNKNGIVWQDLTYKSYQDNLVLGWRLQFDGTKYRKSFLLDEYKFLIEKAKQDKQFALYQLGVTAYPRLKENPDDPKLVKIKNDLMSPIFLQKIMSSPHININFFSKEIKKNKKLILTLLKNNPNASIETLNKNLLNDDDVARYALSNNGNNLQNFSKRIKSNVDIVEIAVKNKRFSLKYANLDIRSNRQLMLKWSKSYKISSSNIADDLKTDKELARVFIENDAESYLGFNDTIMKDKELAALAFENSGLLMQYAPKKIQQNKKLLSLAAKNDARILAKISNNFVNDREFSLELICQNQNTYQYLPADMIADEKIAFIAIAKYSGMLRYAPNSIKHDRNFMLKVARVNPYIYQDLSPILRADEEIAYTVFRQMHGHWHRAPHNIKNDPEMQSLIKNVPQYVQDRYIKQSNESISTLCKPHI